MNTHSLHQRLAILYLALSIPILVLMISDGYESALEKSFLLEVILFGPVIATAPFLLLRSPFRKWFYWPDALSEKERAQLLSLDSLSRNRLQKSSDVGKRLKPYLIRIFSVMYALALFMTFLLDPAGAVHFFLMLPALYLLGLVNFCILAFCLLDQREKAKSSSPKDNPKTRITNNKNK